MGQCCECGESGGGCAWVVVWRCDASLFSSHYFADSELMVSASIGIVEVWQYGDGFSDGAPEVHLRALTQENKEKMKANECVASVPSLLLI